MGNEIEKYLEGEILKLGNEGNLGVANRKTKVEGGVIKRWRLVHMQRSRWGRRPFEIEISNF